MIRPGDGTRSSGASYALKLTAAGAKAIAVEDAGEPKDAGEESDTLANRDQAAIPSKLDAKDARPEEAMEPGPAGPSAPRGGSKLARVVAPAPCRKDWLSVRKEHWCSRQAQRGERGVTQPPHRHWPDPGLVLVRGPDRPDLQDERKGWIMSVKLTDAQLVMMSAATQRKDRCLSAPATIKGAALSKVSAKLAKLGLVREIEAKPGAPVWRRDDAGQGYALKLTAAGLKAIAVDEGSQDAIEPGEAPQPQAKDRASPDQEGHPARLAAPRDGSKLALVIELLRRADGATIVDLTQATGWLPHTTRAALTGLRKRGYAVIRERIGAGDSAYRISGAPAHKGDRTVRQRDAMDGRGPTQKATQAA